MALDVDEVRRIADLARLRLSPEEEVPMARQMSAIVGYFDQLKGYDTAEPAAGDTAVDGAEAADEPAPGLPRDRFLANAPETRDGFLVVPRVVDDG